MIRTPRRALLALASLSPLPVTGCAWLKQGDDTVWADAPCYDVALTPEGMAPRVILLSRGDPVRLQLVNRDTRLRDFTAPRFFANVATRPGEALFTVAGGIDLPAGACRSIVVMPLIAGTWPLESRRAPFPPGTAGTIMVVTATG